MRGNVRLDSEVRTYALDVALREQAGASSQYGPNLLPLRLLGDNDGEVLVAFERGVVGGRCSLLALLLSAKDVHYEKSKRRTSCSGNRNM